MRAVRYHEFGGPEVLEVDEVDRPTPGANEVLIEIRAASVNAVDTRFRAGSYGSVSLPAIPGGDGAGVVSAVGESVDEFAVGDRVVASGMGHDDGGTFVEYATVPRMKVARLPEGVAFETGAALANVGVTAWIALCEHANLRPTEYCLVHGANGGVGHVAVQLGTVLGADVIGTAGSEQTREGVRDLGASAALDYGSDDLAAEITDATGGAGVDVTLDHRLEDYLALDIAVSAQYGRIITITGDIPAVEGARFQHKELTIRGMAIANTAERRPVLNRVTRLAERGDIDARIAETHGFEEAGEAHRTVSAGGYVGKVVVVP